MADSKETRQSTRQEAKVAEQETKIASEELVDKTAAEIEEEDNGKPLSVRKVGREPNMTDAKKAIVFLSYAKELTLFKDAKYFLKFQSRQFITDNAKDINWLRRHPLNGKEFWEGEYPKSVLNRFKVDSEFLERSEDAFVAAEA